MRNFNSQEGMLKPILRIKIAPEGIPILDAGHKNVQSRVKVMLKSIETCTSVLKQLMNVS